jgi:hypothetical protein
MKYRRIGGAMIVIAAAVVSVLLPDLIKDFTLIGRELVWEAPVFVSAIGLALMFRPVRRRKVMHHP